MPNRRFIEGHWLFTPFTEPYHDPRDRVNRTCGICMTLRHRHAMALVRDRSLLRHPYWRRCSQSDCELNNGIVRRPTAFGSRCLDCRGWYHLEHRHTGISESQWCAHHSDFHPNCVTVLECGSCGDYICADQFDVHPCGEATTGYREVTLTFGGEAGSSPLATGKRFIGFEIEAENGDGVGSLILPPEFGITSDGSLYSGVEVLTPPSRGSVLVDTITLGMETMVQHGWSADSGRCGLHTHIDLRDKQNDPVFLSWLFRLGYAVEDVLYDLQHDPGRRASHYCLPLKRGYKLREAWGRSEDFEFVYNKLRKTPRNERHLDGQRRSKWGSKRYYGFNFHSVFYRGTLEVRIHEGTMDPKRALGWADLIQAVVARAEYGPTPYKKLETFMGIPAGDDKLEAIQKLLDLRGPVMDYMAEHYRKGY